MIVLTGGGTGGHLAIAKALATELNARKEKVAFIGSTRGQDKAWFEGSSELEATFFLPSQGVVNKKGLAKLKALFEILKLTKQAKEILKNLNAKAVISVGGYSAAPASLAAIMLKTPLFIHEQNAATGRLNSILKPFARAFYSSYDLKNYADYPVRDEFFSSSRVRDELKTVLFLGGSQGAKAINELAIALAPRLKAAGINIIHQCGKGSLEACINGYKNISCEAELFEFSKDMPNIMTRADLAISRAGASSLWELAANALPAIFIPYPHAANNHQLLNAKALSECCAICPQNGDLADADKVWQIINEIDIKELSTKLKQKINPNGTSKLVDMMLAQI